jgi:hypothetical protein
VLTPTHTDPEIDDEAPQPGQGEAFFVPDDGVPGGVVEDMVYVRSLASGVIQQAMHDLRESLTVNVSVSERDYREVIITSALQFFWGRDNGCAGWAGLLGATSDAVRRGVVAKYEKQLKTAACPSGPDKRTELSADTLRREARLALFRIADYTRHMAAIHAGQQSDWQKWPTSWRPHEMLARRGASK